LGTNSEVAGIMDSLHDIHALVKLEEYEDVKKSADTLVGVSVEGTSAPKPSEEVSDDDYLSKMQS